MKAVSNGLDHLPLFLAMDLATLSRSDLLAYPEEVLGGADALLRARYENEVLGRLLRHRPFARARELVDFHDDERDPRRAERLATILLESVGACWSSTFRVNAAHLRRLRLDTNFSPSPADVDEAAARWLAWLSTRDDETAPIDALTNLVESVRGTAQGRRLDWPGLLRTHDLFELDHLDALDRDYLRLGVRQIIDVREGIEPLDPHKIHLREEESEAETRFLDQSHYPTGGFSELTNRGSFENLVLSELIYMGEGHDAGVDLFDLRFVEGELLFYSRDSGELRRKRRRALLVLDMTQPLDIQLPGHDRQLLIAVSGLFLAIVRDLALVFFRDSLRFQIRLVTGEQTDEARRLQEILSILLAGPIQHGLLEIMLDTEPDGWFQEGSASRKTYALGFSTDAQTLRRWSDAAPDLHQAAAPLFVTVVNLVGEGVGLPLGGGATALAQLHQPLMEVLMEGGYRD